MSKFQLSNNLNLIVMNNRIIFFHRVLMSKFQRVFCLFFVMYAGTPPASSNESTRGYNAGTSKLCFSMTPPWKTLINSVSVPTTAHKVEDELQTIRMAPVRDSSMQELQLRMQFSFVTCLCLMGLFGHRFTGMLEMISFFEFEGLLSS